MPEGFEDLEIYKLSRELTLDIYKPVRLLPKEEKYALGSQLSRAVLSVGANIAEGYGRYHFKDKIKFMYNARGSLYEVKHFVISGGDLGYFTDEQVQELKVRIDKLAVKLNNYISSLYKKARETK